MRHPFRFYQDRGIFVMLFKVIQTALLVLLFIATFFTASSALHSWLVERLPEPTINLFFHKRDHYIANADVYDTVFVGSSRTYRQVDTPALERELRRRGCHWRVFNFGIPNLTYEESLYVLSFLDSAASSSLQRIAIEEPIGANIYPDRAVSDRVLFFSDWQNTRYRFRNIDTFEEDWYFQWVRRLVALQSFVYRSSGIGTLSKALFPAAYENQNTVDEVLLSADLDFERNGGFTSLDDRSRLNDNLNAVHARFLKTLPEFDARIARARQAPQPTLANERADLIQHLIDSLNGDMLDKRLFVPPSIDRLNRDTALAKAARERGIDTLLFNDPDAYPQFWGPAVWFDSAHLNGNGAAILSRTIAEQWCPAIGNDSEGRTQ